MDCACRAQGMHAAHACADQPPALDAQTDSSGYIGSVLAWVVHVGLRACVLHVHACARLLRWQHVPDGGVGCAAVAWLRVRLHGTQTQCRYSGV